MPNWVTTRVHASKQVIGAMLDTEGKVDFNLIVPFPGDDLAGDGVFCDAETAAQTVLNRPLSDHPLVAGLEAENRKNVDILKMSDSSFEQFMGMLKNFRKCGYLHFMDFAREVWGTKWNASDALVDATAGTVQFETAWGCPIPVLVELSKRFPMESVDVEFADEDIGSNCGRFTLLNGAYSFQDIAPRWDALSKEQQTLWRAFAYKVKGWEPDPDEDTE